MKLLLLAVTLLAGSATFSQTIFVGKGRIEFERTINIRKQSEGDDDNEFMKSILSQIDNFHNSDFFLDFDSTQTLYQPAPNQPDFKFTWLLGPAKTNTIYTDLAKKTRISSKAIFEESYLIKDSLDRIKWRMSEETREIAGFHCRKAVGRICDSVYVTAFYTDEILVSAGPESFEGLPGMILGIAIPRLHTTWFAKKVTANTVTAMKLPAKGKQIDRMQLGATLQKATKDWGKMGPRNVWWTML